MLKTLAHLFLPRPSNNFKAKTLHVSSLSILMVLVMVSQLLISFFSLAVPGVLGISSSITSDELVNLTNQKRREAGLASLSVNQSLVNAASQKGADMIAKNYWAHNAPDGASPWSFFKNTGYRYLYAGENLARDFGDSVSVVNAWMNSPTHRDNLLSGRYREIGIAVIHDTFQGQPTTLVIQMFGTQVASILPVKISEVAQPAEAVLAEVNTEVDPVAEPVIEETIIEEPVLKETLPISWFSSFHLTKAVSISLTLILLTAIIVDSLIITRKKIVRLSGKGLAHVIFLSVLLIILLGLQPGLVL